jgi:hypothetical protein
MKKITSTLLICLIGIMAFAQTIQRGTTGNVSVDTRANTNQSTPNTVIPPAAVNFIEGKLYKFINVNSKLYLGSADFLQIEGNDFRQYADGGQSNIHWLIDKQPQNNFIIKSADEGTCMAIDGEAPNQTISLVNFNSANGQKWVFEKQVSGDIKIKNVLTNKYLGVEEGSFVEGARVKLSGNTVENLLLWRAVEVVPERNYKGITAGTYHIKNVNSGLYIAPTETEVGEGTDCKQQKLNTQTKECVFDLELQEDGTYFIVQKISGLCLELDNLSNAPVFAKPSNSPTIKFRITETESKNYIIKSVFTGQILCIRDGVKSEGGVLSKTAKTNEKMNYAQWVFEKDGTVVNNNGGNINNGNSSSSTNNNTNSNIYTKIQPGRYKFLLSGLDSYNGFKTPSDGQQLMWSLNYSDDVVFDLQQNNDGSYNIVSSNNLKFTGLNPIMMMPYSDVTWHFIKSKESTFKIVPSSNASFRVTLHDITASSPFFIEPEDSNRMQNWVLEKIEASTSNSGTNNPKPAILNGKYKIKNGNNVLSYDLNRYGQLNFGIVNPMLENIVHIYTDNEGISKVASIKNNMYELFTKNNRISLYESLGSANSDWEFILVKDNDYKIKQANSNKYLTCKNGSTPTLMQSTSESIMYVQIFTLESIQDLPNGSSTANTDTLTQIQTSPTVIAHNIPNKKMRLSLKRITCTKLKDGMQRTELIGCSAGLFYGFEKYDSLGNLLYDPLGNNILTTTHLSIAEAGSLQKKHNNTIYWPILLNKIFTKNQTHQFTNCYLDFDSTIMLNNNFSFRASAATKDLDCIIGENGFLNGKKITVDEDLAYPILHKGSRYFFIRKKEEGLADETDFVIELSLTEL